jgi:putative PIN family toxin of toxin-antitoxin system
LDTNVWISALFWTGSAKTLMNLARRGRIKALMSPPLLDELRDILIRADKPFHLSSSEADRVIEEIRSFAILVFPIEVIHRCQDEADNRVLECALEGQADAIVTGDRQLLNLAEFKNIPILSLSALLRQIAPSVL